MIGLLPAAGYASRLNGLPKFLLPVPEGNLIGLHVARLIAAGSRVVLIGAGYHNGGLMYQYAPAGTETYLINSRTMSETVLAARDLAREDDVLFGMPDTYWQAQGVYERLATLISSGVDVAVAVWHLRADQRGGVGQCYLNPIGRVIQVVDKDPACNFPYLWGALAWTADFWQYIDKATPHVGYALQSAIEAGCCAMAVQVEGDYFDCGTAEQYFACVRQFEQVTP